MATSHTAAREATLRMAASLEPAGPAVAEETPAKRKIIAFLRSNITSAEHVSSGSL